MEALRTHDSRFQNLPGFDFRPNYVEGLPGYEGLRGHYLDEGPEGADEVFLCLHGEPTWSYLYRKMIPVFAGAGARVVAPDWLGFGRSDKPVEESDYSFHFHRDYMLRFIEHLDLQNITLVCQDWGGVLGLTIPMAMPDRFKRLIIMNTGLIEGPVDMPAFDEWQAEIESDPNVPIAAIMKKHATGISDDEAQAYEAPFPDQRYKAGVRRFPALIPRSMDAPGIETGKNAARFWSNDWNGKSFMAIGMKDRMLGPRIMGYMRTVIRDCPAPLELADAGHFVQESDGARVALSALDSFGLAQTNEGVSND